MDTDILMKALRPFSVGDVNMNTIIGMWDAEVKDLW